ncbi:MAG: IPT/TIG domain-containing protein, partial [Candidatus Desantisbacteria bacterium]
KKVTAFGYLSDEKAVADFEILPLLILSLTSGRVGDEVSVEGSGFKIAENIHFYFGSNPSSLFTNVTANANGTFSSTFIVDIQSYATKICRAQGNPSGIQATSPFFIMAKISINPSSGYVGSLISISGTGFGSETVEISFGTHQTITTTTSDQTGYFYKTFYISTQTFGTKVITAEDSLGAKATHIFVIMPDITLLIPLSGKVGTELTLCGTGYGDKEDVIIDFGGYQTLTTTISSEHGTFSLTFTVTTAGYGANILTARCSSGFDTTVFSVFPEIILLTPTEGGFGQPVTLEGTGYQPLQIIRIDFGLSMTITTTLASEKGTFSLTFLIDTQAQGTALITAWLKDDLIPTNDVYSETSFLVQPSFYITPDKGVVGSQIFVKGYGFEKVEAIDISFGEYITITTATTDGRGYFEKDFLVDTQVYGTKGITATSASGIIETGEFFIIESIIKYTPQSGRVGDIIELEGTGFSPPEVYIDFGTSLTITTRTISGYGTFSLTFAVDTQSYSTKVITITSHFSLLTTCFFILPKIIVNPERGPFGTSVTIFGTGFNKNQSNIRVDFGTNEQIIIQQNTDENGTFSAIFHVNTQPNGTTVVSAVDLPDTDNIFATTLFWIEPKIGVIPSSGCVGSIVTVQGKGFGSNTVIRLDFGNYQTITTATTGTDGAFSATFIVNTQGFGTKVITAKDG